MKNKFLIIFAAALVPAFLFGSEDAAALAEQYFSVAGRYSDYIPRIFNFTIFAGLTYYLVASPIKAFFVGRRDSIAQQLNDIEKKLQEAKDARKKSELALEESKSKAQEIANDSKKEVELLKAKFADMTEKELALLAKQFEEKEELEERKMVRETIDAVLNENISADDIPMSADKVIDVIARKVA